jgi:hypothetical protein
MEIFPIKIFLEITDRFSDSNSSAIREISARSESECSPSEKAAKRQIASRASLLLEFSELGMCMRWLV